MRHATTEALPELHACLEALRKRLMAEKNAALGAQKKAHWCEMLPGISVIVAQKKKDPLKDQSGKNE